MNKRRPRSSTQNNNSLKENNNSAGSTSAKQEMPFAAGSSKIQLPAATIKRQFEASTSRGNASSNREKIQRSVNQLIDDIYYKNKQKTKPTTIRS